MVKEFLPHPFSNVHPCVIICFITKCTSPNISMRRIWLEKMIRKSRQIIKQKYQDIPYNRRVYNLTNKAKAFVVSSCCLTTTYWLLYITLFHVRKYFKLPFSSFLKILQTPIQFILVHLDHLGPFGLTSVYLVHFDPFGPLRSISVYYGLFQSTLVMLWDERFV